MNSFPLWPLIATFLVGIFSALQGLAYKYAFTLKNRPLPNAAILNLTMGVAALVLLFFSQDTTIYTDYRIYVIAVAQGLAFVGAVYFISKASDMGFMGIGWAFLGMSILAVILGTRIFLGEPLYISDALSLVVFLAMIFLMQDRDPVVKEEQKSAKKLQIKKNLICAALFFLNAVILIAYRFKKAWFTEFGSDTNSALMAAVSGFTATIFALCLHYFMERGANKKLTKTEWKGGIVVGITLILIVFFNFPAMELPAAVMFPISQGISILGGVALIAVIYKEKLSVYKKWGIFCAFLIILMSGLREYIAKFLEQILK